ncbi:hypothetical protein ACCS64_38310, partial [Rhizobium ruizarguesonis]
QSELAGGASAFAFQPALRKPGFLRSDEGDGLAALVYLLGYCLKENGPLRLFADHIRKGAHLDARVDAAQPDRQPAPRPEIRLVQRPIGP